MATTVTSWAELLSAYENPPGDNTIIINAATINVGASYTFKKSLIYRLDSSKTVCTFQIGANKLTLNGNSGGINQTWIGPFVFDKQDNSGVALEVIEADGDNTVHLYNVTLTNSSDDDGLFVDCQGNNTLTVNCYGCKGIANGNDGFKAERTAGTTYPTLNLYNCVGMDNDDDGVSTHDRSTINLYGGIYDEIALQADANTLNAWGTVFSGQAASVLITVGADATCNLTDCTLLQPTGSSGDMLVVQSSATLNLINCTTNNLGDEETIVNAGTVNFYGGSLTVTHDNNKSLAIGSGTTTLWDVTVDLNYTCTAGPHLFLPASGGTINLYRCKVDLSDSSSSHINNIRICRCVASTAINVEGCIFLVPDTGTADKCFIVGEYQSGCNVSSFKHNTIYSTDDDAPSNDSVYAILASSTNVTVRGNIFVGCSKAIVETNNGYDGNEDSGYNVFDNNTTDFTNCTANTGDVTSNVVVGFVNAPTDLRTYKGSGEYLVPAVSGVTAYQQNSFDVTITIDGSGTVERMPTESYATTDREPVPVNENGIDAGAFNNPASPLILNAIPDEGYYFYGWSGDVSGDANPITINAGPGDKEVTATFKRIVGHKMIGYPIG